MRIGVCILLYDLDEDIQIEILKGSTCERGCKNIDNIFHREISKIIDKLPVELQNAILEKLAEEEKEELKRAPYLTVKRVKGLHTPHKYEDYIAVEGEKTVEEVLNVIRSAPEDIEVVYIYMLLTKRKTYWSSIYKGSSDSSPKCSDKGYNDYRCYIYKV
ncbi:MAG: hypothetical protein Q9M89_04935 [Persephonella sp.]|nr:hypothetical protein [Persephonella sp.]